MRTIVKTVKVNHYICERCGYEWQDKMFIETCPKHGEFCVNCSNKNKGFIFIVCPECKITERELLEQLTKSYEGNIPILKLIKKKPFIVIKEDQPCYWIGSKN